jgi:ribosome-binding protein aMBF1 (putative translation factor)
MKRAKQTHRTRDALAILGHITGDDPAIRAEIDTAAAELHVAQLIYDARTAAGLTQQQLARLAKTRQPVIARLESADYEGHSMSMLKRIADALGLSIELRMVPRPPRRSRARQSENHSSRRRLVA